MPLQNWGPVPENQYLEYNSGVFVAPAVLVPFIIKDIQGTTLDDGAIDIRLRGDVYYDDSTIEWVNPDSYNANGYPNNGDAIPYENGMSFNFTPTFQNLDLLPPGTYFFHQIFLIDILTDTGFWEIVSAYNYYIELHVSGVVVPPEPVLSFSPETLTYTHKQNESLQSLGVLLTGNLWKIIGKPNFILSSATAGVTIVNSGAGPTLYQTISGSGNAIINIALTSFYDTENPFAPEQLAGTFEILENDVHFGNINWTVSVSRLSNFLTIPYGTGQKAFTLDPKFFEFQSENTDTYFQFNTTIKTYDFFTNIENENVIPQKIVLFKGKQKVNIGQLIHRLMQKFDTPNNNLTQYKCANIKIVCTEKSLSDGTVIRSETSQDISFVAGLSRGITNLGFLDFNLEPNRVTKNSFAYLNILTPTGSYELRTFKNGTLISSPVALPESIGIIFCKKVTFETFEQGDSIQFVVDLVGETNANAPKKTFIVFPEGKYSNHIVWEDEFLLQKSLECTGTASIIPEGEFQSQTIYVDLVERLEHLSSSKAVRLNINTGWLAYSDIDTIESLMRSKKVWLIQGNQFINLRPISKKLPERDLETELIQFQLEFKINQTYNEETYSL